MPEQAKRTPHTAQPMCRCEPCVFGRSIRFVRESLGWSLEQGALPIGLLPAELDALERNLDPEAASRLDLAVYAYRIALLHGAELIRRGE